MGKNKTAMLIDFDNTLFFTNALAIKASKELTGSELTINEIRALPWTKKRDIYGLAFFKYYMESIPNPVMIKRTASSTGKDKILLTAKTSATKSRIASLLASEGITMDAMIFRPERYLSKHDEEWKCDVVKRILKKYDKLEIYEDKKDNINYFKSNMKGENIEYFLVSKKAITKT